MAFHAPHLHNVRLCTCAYRNGSITESSKRMSAPNLNANSSGPRYDPQQLLRRSTFSSDPLTPVNGPGTSTQGKATSRTTYTGMDSPALSRLPAVGTDMSTHPSAGPSHDRLQIVESDDTDYTQCLKGIPDWLCSCKSMASLTNGEGPSASARSTRLSNADPRSSFARSLPTHLCPAISTFNPREEAQSAYDYQSQPQSAVRDSDHETIADDADDDRSTQATGHSPSLDTLGGDRKRRRCPSTTNGSRPRITRRRLGKSRQQRDISRSTTPPVSLHSRDARRSLSIDAFNDSRHSEQERTALQNSAMDLLEKSHGSLRTYLASCFESNKTLRAELAHSRREQDRLETKLDEAERSCVRYWTALAVKPL